MRTTARGKLRDGMHTATFKAAVRVPVHVPLSGKTMAFDGGGNCVEGC
jgi:hypothetical protein